MKTEKLPEYMHIYFVEDGLYLMVDVNRNRAATFGFSRKNKSESKYNGLCRAFDRLSAPLGGFNPRTILRRLKRVVI